MKVGRAYYHPDCLDHRQEIQEVTDLFLTYVNSQAIRSVLSNVVNHIVYVRGVSPAYLKFALKYYIDHHIRLQYPQGLYYVVQNQEVKKAFDRMNLRNERKEFAISENNTIKESDFTFTPTSQKGFGDILK